MIADKSISKVLVTVLFFSCFLLSCATTQDITLTHQQIFGLEKRAENMEKSLRDLKEKDSALELKLQELLKRLADLDIQLRHGQEQFLTLEVRIEEYKQLLDRSLRDRARENEMILMRMDQMQTHLEKLAQDLQTLHSAQLDISSEAANDLENLDEESFYNVAYETFKKGEFDKARELFDGFLEKFPNGKYSDNARYWTGECFYRKNQYAEAILEYEKVKKDYPSGDKVPSALFKQALSFLKLNKKDEAKIILKDLVQHYPQSEQFEMAKSQLETLN